jgi:hypothetical protein
MIDNSWQPGQSMDDAVAKMPKAQPIEAIRGFVKSRLKYKKCHLGRDEQDM